MIARIQTDVVQIITNVLLPFLRNQFDITIYILLIIPFVVPNYNDVSKKSDCFLVVFLLTTVHGTPNLLIWMMYLPYKYYI